MELIRQRERLFQVQANIMAVFFLLQVILNVLLNIAGVAFAIAAIVLYSINLTDIYLWWICHDEDYYYRSTPPPVDPNTLQKCEESVALLRVSAANMSSTTASDGIKFVY